MACDIDNTSLFSHPFGNNVDMLAWAGLGIAMGAGVPEALEATDVVAPPFDQNGLAWAIEQ